MGCLASKRKMDLEEDTSNNDSLGTASAPQESNASKLTSASGSQDSTTQRTSESEVSMEDVVVVEKK